MANSWHYRNVWPICEIGRKPILCTCGSGNTVAAENNNEEIGRKRTVCVKGERKREGEDRRNTSGKMKEREIVTNKGRVNMQNDLVSSKRGKKKEG